MYMIEFSNEKRVNSLNKILLLIIVLILFVFFSITLIGFLSGNAKFKKNLRKIEPIPENVEVMQKKSVPFAGLGRIRCSTKPENENSINIPVVISPWFNYNSEDLQFYEELSKKSGLLKAVVVSYFSENTKSYFLKIGEKSVKSELIKRMNEKLVLGKIQELFFSEYIFLD